MCSTFITLFCGFMIKPEDFPTFWIFMYWLDPLHYALEGINTTQFNRDDTIISITGTQYTTTASAYVEAFYSEWRYRHRGLDILALCLFIIFFRYKHTGVRTLEVPVLLYFSFNPNRIATYFSLQYLRHDKR
jgi:hypothetical protein